MAVKWLWWWWWWFIEQIKWLVDWSIDCVTVSLTVWLIGDA